nr:TIR-like protein FxsC [Micromonospora sp. DSM 115978]
MIPAAQEKPLPYFFVSYAHDDAGEDDTFVRTFFHDLRADVRLHSGVREDTVGFLDADHLRAGHRWSPELVRALGHCRVLIALCSPTYFSSPSCGKEWTAYEQRLRDHESRTRRPAPPSLIPLFWVPVPDRMLPAAVGAYQHRDDHFGAVYRRHGVRDLVRLVRHRDDYRVFVSTLARRIVALAPDGPPPTDRLPAFEVIKAAFPVAEGPARTAPRDGRDPRDARLPDQRRPALPDVARPARRPILNPNPTPRSARPDDRGGRNGTEKRLGAVPPEQDEASTNEGLS